MNFNYKSKHTKGPRRSPQNIIWEKPLNLYSIFLTMFSHSFCDVSFKFVAVSCVFANLM